MKTAFSLVLISFALAGLALGCAPKPETATPAANTSSATPAAKADVTFDVAMKPIIDERCSDCHTTEQKGRLSLLTRDSTLAGGKSGPVVIPVNADGSLLYKMVTGQPGLKRMPPKGSPLTDAQIATIKSWIDGGAK